MRVFFFIMSIEQKRGQVYKKRLKDSKIIFIDY